jgi:hypothetical protein
MHDITGTFGPHPWWAAPFFFLANDFGWLGWLIIVLAALGTITVLTCTLNVLSSLLLRLPPLRHLGTASPVPAGDGRDLLRANVRAASIPELESAALARARDLYGPDANLTVEAVENIATSSMGEHQFIAAVYVRRLPGLAPAPAVLKSSVQEGAQS